MADMISFGDWVRQRRRTLHLTQAILADRVGCAVVTIKKIEQEVRRPSIEMAEILADQLGVSSVDRPRFLAMARGQMLDASPAVNAISLPPFLVQPRQHSQPRLVTRPIEMECLSSQLQQMLMARVQLCFIRGEAGRGKTSLMQAFAHQAQRDVPELIIAKGSCSAHIGQGDPFLPIRDIFDCLTGDIEAHVQANLLDFGLARRLWHFMPEVAQSLIDEGSDLFEILVSPSALHTRLNDAGVTQISGIDRLWQISQQPAHRSDQTQSQLFEQITRVLGKLSQSKPLLLLFDDLQWIDETSLALLFHLSRRLLANRIMIVATYRGSELADAHPLRTTLAELTRRFGNIELDLEAGDVQDDRAFFEALVDQQAPQLDDAFRNHLFALTDGHPLFTVELLHHLQQENYLVRDKQGEWVQEKNVYFETLPSRIDAVISQRISQLDVERQEILRVAAIEGERFTAQVVAATLNMDERVVLSHLTHLAQHHGIVQEYSHERLEQRYLSRYQFRHALFTQYLYRSLGQGERYLLHQATAQKLEQLAGSQHEKYAMTLAYHYGQAGDTIKSAKYHYVAGDQARQASALIEALNHYEVALARWPPDQAADRAELLCKRADCLRTLGRQADALPLLEEAHALFTEIDNPIRAGDTLRRSGRLYWELGESKTGALYYQKALALLETCPESVELAETMSAIGRMHMTASEPEEAVHWAQRAIKLAERLEAEAVVVHANNALGPSLVLLNKVDQGVALLQENIMRARDLKLNYEACCGYVNLDGMLKMLGRYDERSPLQEGLLDYAKDVHSIHYVGMALTLLSETAWYGGQWRQALAHYQALQEWDQGHPLVPVVKLTADGISGMIYNDLNQPKRAHALLEKEIDRARAIDELILTLPILGQMAQALAALGQRQEVLALIREMIELVDRTPTLEGGDLLLKAHLWLVQQPEDEAHTLAQRIRDHLQHFDEMSEIPLTNTIWREAEGTFALREQDTEKALVCFEQASSGWGILKRPYDQSRALQLLAQTLQQTGDTLQAQTAQKQAKKQIEILANQLDDEALHQAFLEGERTLHF